MSYTVLARRYRPQQFAELIGQDTVNRALINSLKDDRLHHAYLFTGTRGVGKTTVARLLAKCLNCEMGPTATPCGSCIHCIEIQQGSFPDLIEIDAASRTKVEDTRDILENVQYLPTRGKYKIYLIDEVHMLSNHSFNALLKTLEEPPKHVIFLLATTDPQKIPATVLSRCLQFTLKRVSATLLSAHLATILERENIQFEKDALDLLAQAARGSVRDALSLTDQAIAFSDGSLTLAHIQDLLGSVKNDEVITLLTHLAAQDGAALVQFCQRFEDLGGDFALLLDRLLEILHAVALQQLALAENTPTIAELSKQLSKEDTQLYYQIALFCKRDFDLAPTPRLSVEMALLRMLAFTPQKKTQFNAEIKEEQAEKPVISVSIEQPAQIIKPEISDYAEEWTSLVNKLALKGPVLALAEHCIWLNRLENNIDLALNQAHAPLLSPQNQKRLQEALSDYFAVPIRLTIKADTTQKNTPANIKKQQQVKAQDEALEQLQLDPALQKLLASFDGKLDPQSIKVGKK